MPKKIDNPRYFVYRYRFPDGRVYIGQSHEGSSRYGNISSYRCSKDLYEAMRDPAGFSKEIVQWCDRSEADYWEEYWIEFHDATDQSKGYNRRTAGIHGRFVCEESRKAMSVSHMKENISEEYSRKMAAAKLGTHLSDSAKRKISERLRNRKHPNQSGRRIRCVETGIEYGSEKAAGVSHVARSIRLGQRAGGAHWEYIGEGR